jgi:hypothetical protein
MNKGVLGIFAVALAASACTPSPERVCDHIRELEQRSGRHQASRADEDRAGCLRTMTAVRSRDSSAYKTAARCIMNANDEHASDLCIMPLLGIMDH